MPVAITVEGANILTRSLIIFGQGAVRCHPFVLKRNERREAIPNREAGVREFDAAIMGHVGFAISNAVRSLVLASHLGALHPGAAQRARRAATSSTSTATAHRLRWPPMSPCWRSAAISRKRKPCRRASAMCCRSMYLASMVLKHHENQGRDPADDLPLVEWACRSLLYQAQEQLHLFLRNFPNRPLAAFMRLCIFPRGLALLAAERPLGPRHRRS